ncbi:uncharacterized protein LOC143245572 [Tachypleus tridentatus]|uniref:uncharacterized protein LOC143245572 n=1 Tax=Tachypleus tridentatus TaxID=6853 RepID=UPI003FD4FE4E
MKMKNNKQRKENFESNFSDANSQNFNNSDKEALGLTLSLNDERNKERSERIMHTSERESAQKVNRNKRRKTVDSVSNHDVEDSFRDFKEDGGENLLGLTLSERLEKEDAFIQSLIDTIPPEFYFDQETREFINSEKFAYVEEKQMGKKKMQKELSIKGKHKRARLDPNQHKTVSQILNTLAVEEEEEKRMYENDNEISVTNLNRVSSLDELHQRLHEKIQMLQAQRKELTKHEWREKRKIRNKMYQLKRKEKQKKMKVKKMGTNTFGNKNVNTELLSRKKARPIYNKEGKLVYSKFDFSESGIPEKKKGEHSGKNHKKILEHVQQDKIKLQKLEVQNPEKAQELQEKTSWMKAIDKAEGVKVKDNTELLKKSMKKEEQKKKKSRKQWQTRLDNAKKIQLEKQKRRRDNIHAKKQEKIAKRIKRAKNKGRLVPGF